MSEEPNLATPKSSFDDGELRRGITFLRQLPSFNAAVTMLNLHDGNHGLDLTRMRGLLAQQGAAVSNGDLARLETMLTTQAHVLDSMFNKYVAVAAKSEHLEQFKCFQGIALKAQNQCRQTISILGELKNPKRATFIKQQNNAVNQQINQAELQTVDGDQFQNQPNSENIPTQANELLGPKIERMDEKASEATKSKDPQLEAVGALNRTEHNRR